MAVAPAAVVTGAAVVVAGPAVVVVGGGRTGGGGDGGHFALLRLVSAAPKWGQRSDVIRTSKTRPQV